MKKNILKFYILALLSIGAVLTASLTNHQTVHAANGNVNVVMIPFKDKNIWGGREDRPVEKMRISLSGAYSGNGGGWTYSDTQQFRVNTSRAGAVHLAVCEVIFKGNVRVVFQKNVWIDSNTNNIWIAPN